MEKRKIYLATLIGISAAVAGTAGVALANDDHDYDSSKNTWHAEHSWSQYWNKDGKSGHDSGYWNSKDGKDGRDGKDGYNGKVGGYGKGDDDDSSSNDEWNADLQGSEEVPERSTDASGDFTAEVSGDEDSVAYDLNVFDGEDITMAHLHCAPRGENGPIVVTLFHDEDGVDVDGNLSDGTFDDDDVEATGANCDNPIYDLEDLMREVEDGNIYVNVHSKEYPAGEIRGQVGVEEGNTHNDDDDDYDSNGGDDHDYGSGHGNYGGHHDDDDGHGNTDDHHDHYGSGTDDDDDDHGQRDRMSSRMRDIRDRIDAVRDRVHERMHSHHWQE